MTKNYALSEEIKTFIIEMQTKQKNEYHKLSEKQKGLLIKNMPIVPKIDTENLFNTDSSLNLKNGQKIKINYNKNSTWLAMNGTSQITIPNVLKEFLYDFDDSKTPKKNFLDFLECIGIGAFLDWICQGMSKTDLFLQIPANLKGIKLYNTSHFKWDFTKEIIETDIFESQEKNTWFIDVNGIRLFQIQAPPSVKRLKNQITRINLNGLSKYYNEIKNRNNETFGISVEVALCKLNNLNIPVEYSNRWDEELVEETLNELRKQEFSEEISNMTEILAADVSGRKKSPTDFMIGETRVSVKSNFGGSTKVCPPDIGQPGMEEGLEYYNGVMNTNFTRENVGKDNFLEFKKKIQEYISVIVFQQAQKLFSEDKILYVRKLKTKQKIQWIDTDDSLIPAFSKEFTFTRTPEEWNESVSIKYEGISLAEMQIHSNRSPFKFRFNMPNLMRVIKNSQQ